MTETAETAALIVAAGRGRRMGGGLAKQWRPLAGRPVAAHSIAAFAAAPGIDRVLLVLHPQDMERAGDWPDIQAVAGGETRAASVRAGLEALDGRGVARVLIHDAARPLVSQRIIADVIAALATAPGAAPGLPVADSLWRGKDGRVIGTADREGLFRAQTPQGFDFGAILAAHRAHPAPDTATDDVAIALAAGLEIAIVPGEERNLKLTWPEDFARAEALLGAARMDIRMGNGFDVHRFGPGDGVILCGVEIAHDRGLQGHSDADVAMHAVTDAIYGALAEGDIGRHFPPSDPQWKGADSAIFLTHAVRLAANRGFAIGNIDVTIIAERPRIGPHAGAMTARMAEITGLEPGRISVKATTSERLGFTGREEGIAALATATLVRT